MSDHEELIRLRAENEVLRREIEGLRNESQRPDEWDDFDIPPPGASSWPSRRYVPQPSLDARLAALVPLICSVLRSDRCVALLLFAIVAVPYFAGAVGVMNSMDGPQYALTRAIVDRHTLSINGYEWIYPDFALVDGKQYSQRSPGISFLAAPLYLYSRAFATHLWPPYLVQNNKGITHESALEAMSYGMTGLIGAATVALFFLIVRQHGAGMSAAVAAALVYGFGSLLWAYASSFVREPGTILFLFGAYLAYLLARKEPRQRDVLLVGICSGLAIFCDNLALFPAVILLSTTLLVVFRGGWTKLMLLVVVGFLVGLLPLVVYNLRVFDRPYVIQYLYAQREILHHTELHLLADPFWSVGANLFNWGALPKRAVPYVDHYPEWADAVSTVWALKSPYKGILVQSPILVLAIGYAVLHGRRDRSLLLPLVVAASFFLPLSRTSYFFNPNNFDTRYFLPATAFLFVPLGAAFERINKQRGGSRVALVLAAALLALISLLNGWDGVLQNYTPHQTGNERASISLIARRAAPFSAKIVEAFYATFPNYANVLYLLPIVILLVLYALALPLQRLGVSDMSSSQLEGTTPRYGQ